MAGNTASGPRASWKQTPGLKERVIAFCAEKGSAAGNGAIGWLIKREFNVDVTPGQIAGAVHRWGILRGHPVAPPIADAGASEERVQERRRRHNDYRLMSEEEKEAKRLERVSAAVERRKEHEANRERRASMARQVNSQRLIPSEPKVNTMAMARHDREMARPSLTQMASHMTEPERLKRHLMGTLDQRAIKGTTLPALASEVGPPRGNSSPAYGRVIECQTITNTGSFGIGIEQCGQPSKPGKPYCEACCEVNYVHMPKSRTASSHNYRILSGV